MGSSISQELIEAWAKQRQEADASMLRRIQAVALQKEMGMEGLIEGRMVHYVMEDGHYVGAHRPAVIVRVWDHGYGTCNLQVFTDCTNDGDQYADGLAWKTSRVYSEGKEPGTWHWIERA
jgi:hypothetical protein